MGEKWNGIGHTVQVGVVDSCVSFWVKDAVGIIKVHKALH